MAKFPALPKDAAGVRPFGERALQFEQQKSTFNVVVIL
jgi:hypothetical protein